MVAVELAGKYYIRTGFSNKSTWADLAAGSLPPNRDDETILGEWQHGWQYYVSNQAETNEFNIVLADSALPKTRANATSTDKSRIRPCMGRFVSVWMTICPTSQLLMLSNDEMQCAIRRSLGLERCFEGSHAHGHGSLTDNRGGKLNARHNGLLATWKQILVETGSKIPDKNKERILINTHIPAPPADRRRLDLIDPGLNIYNDFPLFCDIIIVTPIVRDGKPRPATNNIDDRLLEIAQSDNDQIYNDVTSNGLGMLLGLRCEVY